MSVIRGHATRLEEQRLAVLESYAEYALACGDGDDLVAELSRAIAQHPLRERLTVLLMRALYRSGRQAEALTTYRRTSTLLAEELGVDPGPDLARTFEQILRQDPELDAPHAPTGTARVLPAQLPADVAAFTGRSVELDMLHTLLGRGWSAVADASAGPSSTQVVISVVCGPAGVGKTALAVHWAHQACHRFPDGQLHVDLRGYGPDQPMTAADALARFLTALGVAGPQIPVELDERAARYRSEVAGRRLLMVLDNASSVEQVRPLLPGTGTCAVVVTSRERMSGLVARDGAERVDLDLLPPADAHTLLCRLLGPRAGADPAATAALADLCVRLPLALRVAAELAAARPAAAVADLVEELADRRGRLDLLDAGGDPHAAVAEVFSWSLQHLRPEAARVFRLLGLHPGPDIDGYAVAALAGTDLAQAHRDLGVLARASLIQPTADGRYQMHDLLRAYAASLTATTDPDTDRRAALDRLHDYYLATAAVATDCLYPADAARRPGVVPVCTPTPQLADRETARRWLDSERDCLAAVAAHAAAHGRPHHTTRLSAILYRYLDSSDCDHAVAIHTHAHQAAQQAGDPVTQAGALRRLGAAYRQLGRFEPAADHLRQALALCQQASDLIGEARARTNLGIVEERCGRYGPAAGYHTRALQQYRQAGDPVGEARALTNLGTVWLRQGRYQTATRHTEQALALFRQVGDPAGEAQTLANLGTIELHQGRHQSAARHAEQALVLFRQTGNPRCEACTLQSLGTIHTRAGQPDQARRYHQQALTLLRRLGDREGQAWALNGLGEAAGTGHRPTDAVDHHSAALEIATNLRTPDQQARAHTGLGHAHRTLGNPTDARRHYEHALRLYTDLDAAEAGDIRAHLTALARSSAVSGPASPPS
jgi:tetratricopeptide (TPR) repeat protein